jgi:hypothetical protein
MRGCYRLHTAVGALIVKWRIPMFSDDRRSVALPVKGKCPTCNRGMICDLVAIDTVTAFVPRLEMWRTCQRCGWVAKAYGHAERPHGPQWDGHVAQPKRQQRKQAAA